METNINNYIYKFKAIGRIQSGPYVYSKIFFFGTYENYLYAVDINTGNEIWKFQTNANVKNIIAENGVVFCTSYDNFYAISILTGKQLWKFKAGQMFSTIPSIEKGIVFLGSQDGKIYGIDIPSGQKVWEWNECAPISSSLVCNNLMFYWTMGFIMNGITYVSSDAEGSLKIIDMNGDQIIEEFTNKFTVFFYKVNDYVIFSASLRLYCFDTINQTIKWNTPMDDIIGFSIINENEVLIGTVNKILTLNIVNCEQKIIHRLNGFPSFPKINNNMLYYKKDGQINEVDLKSNELIKYESNNFPQLGLEVIEDILLFAHENYFYSI